MLGQKSKMNKQGCGLARKRHGNGVINTNYKAKWENSKTSMLRRWK